MAVNSLKKPCDKIQSKYSSHSPRGNISPSNYLVKLDIVTEASSISAKSSSKEKKNKGRKSPYLMVESTPYSKEKKVVHKRAADFVSSFPLAANLYKANSGEFKSQKNATKKVKKSVLTLPNMPAAIPQTCTVSDMNDSEYFNNSDDGRKLRPKKRFVAQNKKCKVRNKDFEFYDRDARYCSQMNINLDCSSSDIINHFNGDGKRVSKKFQSSNKNTKNKFNAHDVWAVLRNINRFQFRPSPPMSEESIQTPKKNKVRSKRRNRNSTRVIETCRTEEFAYITNFEIDRKSPTNFSQSSSFDRITVIDKQDEFNEICSELQKNVVTTKQPKKIRFRESSNQNKKNPFPLRPKLQKEDSRLLNRNRHEFDDKSKLLANNNQSIISCEINYGNKKNVNNNQADHKGNDLVAVQSLYSGSSKGAVSIHLDKCNANTQSFLNENINTGNKSDGSSKQLEKTTKVVNDNRCMTPIKQNDILKRRLRLVTTMPSAATMPKLTQTEIRRRLANMKFPIVILGKDQLGSTSYLVMNYEPPQFLGLENNIWPFMQDWYNQDSTKQIKNEHANQNKSKEHLISNAIKYNNNNLAKNNLRKLYNDMSAKPMTGERNTQNYYRVYNKKNNHKRATPPCEVSKPQQPNKQKSMHLLKDKMLKFLYKKYSDREIDNSPSCKMTKHTKDTKTTSLFVKTQKDSTNIDVGIQTVLNYELVSSELTKYLDSNNPSSQIKKKTSMSKHPWAKTKWASDFIENVVKKVRSGVYYSQENKFLKSSSYDSKEASIQTILVGRNVDSKERIVQTDNCSGLKSFVPTTYELPGFGEGFPSLQIKTMNMKEVAVKHSTTNVMIQFDVAIASGHGCLMPLTEKVIPVTLTESKTMVFKCPTAILNAMLPAEICSILPQIMKSIIDSNSLTSVPAVATYQNKSLKTVSECDLSSVIYTPIIPTCLTLSQTLMTLIDGKYSFKINSKKVLSVRKLRSKFRDVINIFTSFSEKVLPILPFSSCNVDPHGMALGCTTRNYNLQRPDLPSTCTALQVYRPHSHLSGTIEQINNTSTINLIEQIWNQFNIRFKLSAFKIPIGVTINSGKMSLNITVEKIDAHEKEQLISIAGLKLNLIYNSCLSRNSERSKTPDTSNLLSCKAIEYKKESANNRVNKNESQTLLTHLKPRKKSYVKLYRKCKSTTNISRERSSTPLSKINNLDEFFQALGSGKSMSSVFDGQAGAKILTSIMEMKNWITDISQRQAMLVLLLTNKKDTPNLVRFRPILLQGIGVNRITRATELDMEIEVIEKENFNKFSQYEGVRYEPEVIENNTNLLEELYWIAKTTASDYQKPFNEASEKLLKSLLEKRKKLNPSYLRVMARYVGLGLLKSPNKI